MRAFAIGEVGTCKWYVDSFIIYFYHNKMITITVTIMVLKQTIIKARK